MAGKSPAEPNGKHLDAVYLAVPLHIQMEHRGQLLRTKKFWSLCSYIVRSCKGIEMLVNRINISYCAMKLLPYQDEAFYKYQTESVQEFRFALSEQIRQQVFYAVFVEKVETGIKSNALINALKQLIQKQGYHL